MNACTIFFWNCQCVALFVYFIKLVKYIFAFAPNTETVSLQKLRY